MIMVGSRPGDPAIMRFGRHPAACHQPKVHDHRHRSDERLHFTPRHGLISLERVMVVRSRPKGWRFSPRTMIMSAAASDSVGTGTHDQGTRACGGALRVDLDVIGPFCPVWATITSRSTRERQDRRHQARISMRPLAGGRGPLRRKRRGPFQGNETSRPVPGERNVAARSRGTKRCRPGTGFMIVRGSVSVFGTKSTHDHGRQIHS